jgi:hypothetical protein
LPGRDFLFGVFGICFEVNSEADVSRCRLGTTSKAIAHCEQQLLIPQAINSVSVSKSKVR